MKIIRSLLLGFISSGMILSFAGTASADLNDGLLGYYSFNAKEV